MILPYEEMKKTTVKEYAQRMLTKAYEGMEANQKDAEKFRYCNGKYEAYKDVIQFILQKEEIDFIENGN